MSKLDDLLAELHLKTVEALLAKVLSGGATAADLNVARQILKDNDITATLAGNPGLGTLKLALPFEDEPHAEVG